MKTSNKNILYAVLLVVFGLFLGWLLFGGDSNKSQPEVSEHSHEEETTWTCSMHPQIRQKQPGKCPICGMDLIPLSQNQDNTLDINEVQMSDAAVKLANVQTTIIKKGSPGKEVYLPGKVKTDETSIAEITARYNGRIEKLFVNFTGQEVRQGQQLATIYSPQLVTAQKELLEAYAMKESNPSIYKSARNKLKLWNISDSQIDRVIKSNEPAYYFSIFSPISGTVTSRNISVGDYVKEGESLMKVANLSKVWIVFNAYESDLPWIKKSDKIDFTAQSIPGETLSGKINFIDPVVNPQTRTTAVRVEFSNNKGLLKPEMIVNGMVKASTPEEKEALMVPISAVLWTGKKSVVYVKKPNTKTPVFEFREVTLGTNTDSNYVVKEGLNAGEEVVTHGTFKIDAAAQLSGKKSMMNPEENKQATKRGEEVFEVKPVFKGQLEAVFKAYLPVKDALIASNANLAQSEAQKLSSALGKVNMELLTGEAHMQWMGYLNPIKNAVEKMKNTADIAIQREALTTLSDNLFHSLKAFQVDGAHGYYQFCPMADNNKGAYWLSAEDEVKNPYFGKAMLTCGEVVDSIGYSAIKSPK